MSTASDGTAPDLSSYVSYCSSVNSSSIGSTALARTFAERSKACFSNEVRLRIIDFFREPNERPRCSSKLYCTAADVENAIRSPTKARVRVISIHSERTIEPLQITPALMLTILSFYAVSLEFVPVILSFGDAPNLAEGSSSFTNVQELSDATKISYQIRYIEENHRKGRNRTPWSLRHTGVYHHHSEDFDLYLMLQPNQESTFERSLLDLEANDELSRSEIEKICLNPFRLHPALFDSYDNWRWYFRYIAEKERFDEKNDLALTQDIVAVGKASLSFGSVQNLRNLQDVMLSSRACCVGNLAIVTRLLVVEGPAAVDFKILEFQKSQLHEHVKSADVLQARIRNTIDWIGYSLNMRNQIEASEANNQLRQLTQELRDMTRDSRELTQELRDMTKDTVDDSVTVKIITFVSTVYLTGSFVASIFGMNFFDFDSGPESSRRRINVTDDLWLFFVVWIPMMVITWGVYKLTLKVHNDRDRKTKFLRRATELSGSTESSRKHENML